jgi:hypothetical protein
MWLLVVLLAGCGSESGGEDAGDNGGDSGSASGNNDPQNSNGSGNGNNSGSRDDGGIPNGDGGKDGGSGSGNNSGNNPMATTGPTKVTGTVAGIKLVSGLAYFDPIGRLDDNDPALKIVLTDWPITGCDPQAIRDIDDATGKHMVACEIYRYRKSLPYPLWIREGDDLGWRTVGDEGCTVELTSGDDDGGEQVIGTINVTAWNNADDIKTIIQVQVNHCGVIDTKGNI